LCRLSLSAISHLDHDVAPLQFNQVVRMTATQQHQHVAALTLALADDALILGHRLSEWSGHAPMLEEDIALSNLALDLIGQARSLYAYAGEIEGRGRDEDQLAFFREAHEFRNCLLVEQPNGDFASTMLRQLFYAAFMHRYYEQMAHLADPRLAEIAAKSVKEMAYHVRHSAEWVIRLGDGTATSRTRVLAALDGLWGYTGELFEMSDGERDLVAAGIAPDRAALKPDWDALIAKILSDSTVPPAKSRAMQTGGRSGRHSEHLGHLLATMQVLARQHPGAKW
jgi:ring-1,2-phenylacetyl-CoA epoxidase subunit PaaC